MLGAILASVGLAYWTKVEQEWSVKVIKQFRFYSMFKYFRYYNIQVDKSTCLQYGGSDLSELALLCL